MIRPTIRQLEYFVAVAKHLHFGNAAREVAISQPALSTQIQQLEDLLEVKLFERNRRKVLLTREGAKLVISARRALRAVDDMVETARPRSPLEGTLRLGVIPTVAPYVLPRVLPGVRDRYPGMRLILVEGTTATITAALRRGELDLVLLALPVPEVGPGFVTHHLFEERFLFACPPDHRLADQDIVQLEDLAGVEMLLLEDGHCLRDHAMEVCQRVAAPESSDVRATSMTTLVQMVESGFGCTLLPELARDVEVGERSRLLLKPFAEEPPPSRSIGLAWRQTSHKGEAFQELGGVLTEELAAASLSTAGTSAD